jgi:hypothetical protein
MNTDVNIPTVSDEQKNVEKNLFFVSTLKATDERIRIWIRNPVYGSKGLDPSQNVTDPEQCFYQSFSVFFQKFSPKHLLLQNEIPVIYFDYALP